MIMSNVDACFGPDELRAYLSGLSDDTQVQSIETHLATCRSCEDTLLSLESENDTMVRRLRDRITDRNQRSSVDPNLRSALDASRRLMNESNQSSIPLAVGWPLPSQVIGPYQLQRPIGTGGMGAVYLARHRELGKQVAIKVLPAALDQTDLRIERFMREIRAAGSLEHPSIVNATDAGQDDGIHYLVMEYIDGLDLSQIAGIVKLSVADACEVIRQAAVGLAYAHAEGVVHRDIKPSNLMLRRDGEVKILDFGLAQISTWDGALAELTTVGQLMGTLDYMSPEQAEQPGKVDYRADIYSLGATLFRLICGRAPLASAPNLSPLAKLRLLANHRAVRLDTLHPNLPLALVELTAQMLSALPEDRPASAAHVAESLAEFTTASDLVSLVKQASLKMPPAKLPSIPISPSLTGSIDNRSRSIPKLTRRRRWLIATGLIGLLTVATVMILLQSNTGQLVIESEIADVSVQLVQDGETTDELRVETGTTATRLRSGAYQVVIGAASDGVSIDKETIEIRRGQTTIARLRRTDPQGDVAVPIAVNQPSGTLTVDSSASVDRTDVDSPQPSPVDPTVVKAVYEGQTLDDWLQVVRSERESERLDKALAAISHLVTAADRQRVTEVLIENQLRLKSSEFFNLLERGIPRDEQAAWYVGQLQQGNLSWQQRILDHVHRSVVDLDTLTRVNDWVFENVFDVDGPQILMRHGLRVAMRSAVENSVDLSDREVRIQRLRSLSIADEPLIPAHLWLEMWRERNLEPWVSELIVDLCVRQITDNDTSPIDLSASIAVLRHLITKHLDLAWKVQQNEPLLKAIDNRIIASDRLHWSNHGPEAGEPYLLRPIDEYRFRTRLRNVAFTGGAAFRHADPLLELLLLAELLPPSDAFQPRLVELFEQTSDGLERVQGLLNHQALRSVTLDWDSLTVKEVDWLDGAERLRPSNINGVPSSQDWFDALVNLAVSRILDRKNDEVNRDEAIKVQ